MSTGEGALPFYLKAIRAAPDQFAPPHHYLAHAYENAGRIDSRSGAEPGLPRVAPDVRMPITCTDTDSGGPDARWKPSDNSSGLPSSKRPV